MIKSKDGSFFISDWLRNANTLEYIGAWESMYNPGFNYGEFALIRNAAGSNTFKVSVKELVEKSNIKCLIAKSGRYGGTYAHKDIAFNFGMWISPVFQLYIVKEYQRLKEVENNQYNLEWNVKRILSKVNYTIQTDAVKEYVIPQSSFHEAKKMLESANADMIRNGISRHDRFHKLHNIARYQLEILNKQDFLKTFKKETLDNFLEQGGNSKKLED